MESSENRYSCLFDTFLAGVFFTCRSSQLLETIRQRFPDAHVTVVEVRVVPTSAALNDTLPTQAASFEPDADGVDGWLVAVAVLGVFIIVVLIISLVICMVKAVR